MLKLLCLKAPCIILFVCLLNFTTPTTCSNNETDFESLVAFKKAIGADPQGALTSWNETVHFCSWQGVFCGRKHPDRVVEIDLSSRGLVGTISPHLGNLSFLQYITLRNNTFKGQIPDEISKLRRLIAIGFSNNSLSGEIPRNLSRCTNLYFLNLIDNELTGDIPMQLSSLANLAALGLAENKFSGTIPPSFGNFTSLWELSLKGCEMQGEIPESLGQLKSLQYLDLSQNNFIGKVPSGLFNSSTMSKIDISFNHLHGTIPSHLRFSFSSFDFIKLSDNYFTGEVPSSLSNFSSLKYVYLGQNSFAGSVMLDFTRLSSLEEIVLANNELTGDLEFISSMRNCTQLRRLNVNNNLISGLMPDSIANLSTRMRYLILSNNLLHGRIPSGIRNLIDLTAFGLDNNYLSGQIPSSIGELNKLQKLILAQNRLTNSIPFSLGNLTLLNTLDLMDNRLSGNIPTSLANCTRLLGLDISQNNLTGTIPPEILSLSSISLWFNLSHNALTGPVPSQVGSLINLISLDLSHNRLSGVIPKSLSSCIILEQLYLDHNFFHGAIPDALTALRGVQYMDLSRNNFSGEIPWSFGRLNLLYLNLSFNKLEGEIPIQGVFLNMSAISLEGNKLCGEIPSLNFPPCSSSSSKKKHSSIPLKILVPVVSCGILSIIVASCYYMAIYKRRVLKREKKSSVPSLAIDFLRPSYADLLKATCGFSESNLLGRGQFGSVYKGTLNDEQIRVAVKVINLATRGGSRSFLSECNALRGIRHRNLLKIVSVCSSSDFQGNEFKALVYEFMENGNLDEWIHLKSEVRSIHDAKETRILNMKQRLSIAMDVASAIEYLHSGTDSVIIHGDLKPSNVLLDEKMIGHVGDFGLAKVISSVLSVQHESSSIGIKGTIGYIAPEYGVNGKVSTEGDVYSYGILLLEMFTGRRPTSNKFNDALSLRDMVKRALSSQVMDIVDPVILQEHKERVDAMVKNCLISAMEIGLACTEELPAERISMTHVVRELHKISHVVL